MSAHKLKIAMLHTLQKAGDMEIMRLAKFLYLADYMYARTFGNRHGFIDEHQRYKYGPVPADFYTVYNALLDSNVVSRTGNIVSLGRLSGEDDISQLSEEELACIDKVVEDFDGKDLTTVKRSAYATEPMVEIQKEEERLGSGILEFKKMDFSSVEVHPLMAPIEDDLSFMDSKEFQENLK